MNNNDKSNTNYVRPVADLCGNNTDGPVVSFADILEAYYACRINKRSTTNEQLFECDSVRQLYDLWQEINEGTYRIGRSICFIVRRPIRREVFAADFRDRIIHHWIALRLEPLFEQYLFPCMMSNRKGKGTSAAVADVVRNIKAVTHSYTRDAWIYKFDLQGFFMSIDKCRLNDKLQAFIDARYFARDKAVLKWLVSKVVMHCPQCNCIRRCSESEWDTLPHSKSLFYQDRFHGIAIGNLTSQQFANFYLRDVVAWLRAHGYPYVTQYVDDFVIVTSSKQMLLNMIPDLRAYLWDELGIRLHPRKSYIQHYTKGVAFIGAVIRPYRTYVSKRMARNMYLTERWLCAAGKEESFRIRHLDFTLSSVNSYCGVSAGHYAYRLREHMAHSLLPVWGRELYFTSGFKSVRATAAYNARRRALLRVRQLRG